MNLNSKLAASNNIRGTRDNMQLLRESLNDSIQDYRISNEIKSRKIEHLIPTLKSIPKGDLFAVGSTIGFYLAGISLPRQIVMADKFFIVTRFNVLYELLLKHLKTIAAVDRLVSSSKFELFKIENALWKEADAAQKNYIQITVKATLKHKGLIFDPSEIIKLIENLRCHYVLKESYLRDQHKLNHLLKLIEKGKVFHLFKDVASSEMDRVAVQLTNWNLNFSTFYLSNISDWFPAHTMQEQIENINNWIYSVPTVKKAVVIKSRCSRYNDLFNTQNHVVGEKNSWFYEIIPLQKKLSQSIQVAANQ